MFSAISSRFSSVVAQAAKKAKPKAKPGKKSTKKPSTGPKKARSEMEPLDNPHPTIPEVNGPVGKEPTRFGDWENKGRTSDF